MVGCRAFGVPNVENRNRVPRRRLHNVVWRYGSSAPLALVGEPGAVRGFLDELTDRFLEKVVIHTDVWVRAPGTAAVGARVRLLKRSLVLLVSTGDVERSRVCLASLPRCCRGSAWIGLRTCNALHVPPFFLINRRGRIQSHPARLQYE